MEEPKITVHIAIGSAILIDTEIIYVILPTQIYPSQISDDIDEL